MSKELVKSSTDLVDLVGSYVQLRRDGVSWKCSCPWHEDSRPSLTVNPSLQIWRCWVCDIGGDCFDWVMKYEKCGFREALELLAERAGIVLDKLDVQRTQVRRTLLEVMEAVAKQYHSGIDRQCREYLVERSINEESIKKWRLGTCVPYQKLGVDPELLIKNGIVGVTSNKRLYDRFSERLIFPITDQRGRVIALGGRVLPSRQTLGGKYVNSPETELFKKAKTLYGLWQANSAIRRSKTAVIMEGYTDVIIAHQYGVENAVACLGTAFTIEHAKQLVAIAEKIVIVLDGDDAGQTKSDSIAEMFIKQAIDASIVTIPDKLDPADWIIKNGGSAFTAMIKQGLSPLAFRMRRICSGIDPTKRSEAASRALDKVVDLAAMCENAIFMAGAVAAQFRVPESAVQAKIAERLRRNRVTSAASSSAAKLNFHPMDAELLSLLVNHPECFPILQERIDIGWIPGALKTVWSVYESREVSGESLAVMDVLSSLDQESPPRRLIESYLMYADGSKVRGYGIQPNASIESRISDLADALSSVELKPNPYANYF